MTNYEETFEQFWKSILVDYNGDLNIDAVKRELHDYHHVLEEVPKIYVEITGGMLSKPGYTAEQVLPVVREVAHRNHLYVHADELEDLLEDLSSRAYHDTVNGTKVVHLGDIIDELQRRVDTAREQADNG